MRFNASKGYKGSFWLVLVLLGAVQSMAFAKPEYARKEGKACQHCHVEPSPGSINPQTKMRFPTDRNPRGVYYATHDHSLVGYKFEARKRATLDFKFQWQEEMTDLPRRMGVGDVTGDGKPRLVTLHESPDNKTMSVLMVRRWNGTAFAVEFKSEFASPSDKLQVGKFAGADKPAIILCAASYWRWDGKTFVRKDASQPLNLFGATRMRNGEERCLIAHSATDIRAYKVDTAATGGTWLSEGIPAPTSSKDLLWGAMHASNEFFLEMGMEPFVADGGVLGIWDPEKKGVKDIYYVKTDRDVDVVPGTQNSKKPQFKVKSETFFVTVLDANGKDLWMSPRLEMRPLDLCIENARGDKKTGLLILLKEPAPGKPRRLGFFELIEQN